MNLIGKSSYKVGVQVANNTKYRLYLCLQENTDRQCLLQIATEAKYNGDLSRSSYILGELENHASELEKEFALVKENPKTKLNYQLGFPQVVESFICREQGGRLVNVLDFRKVEDVKNVVPLVNITNKDKLRVDLRSSVWIMGKYLKLLDFAHSQKISVGLVSGGNILIEPSKHYVIIFDWMFAKIHHDEISIQTRIEEISKVAKAIIVVLGGDLKTGIIPNDGDEGFEKYTKYLLRLARGGESRADRAHAQFYELCDSLWKREFYQFTTVSIL